LIFTRHELRRLCGLGRENRTIEEHSAVCATCREVLCASLQSGFQISRLGKFGLCIAAKPYYGGSMRTLSLLISCAIPTLSYAQVAMPARTISVQSLALPEVGPWGAAAVPTGMVPIASDLWRGGDPGTLSLALARTSADQRFPSMQILVRQVVFSGGLAPTTDPDLARLRFEAASRLGPAEAAARLIFAVPRLSSDAGLAAVAIDAGLRAGLTEQACGLIEAVPVPPQGTSWLEARATCYALNNETDAANLSVDLAKTRGLTDTWLSRAIASVGGPISAPPSFRLDSGRAIALSLRTKLKPPLTLSTITDPAAISALVQVPEFMASLAPDERQALLRNGAARGVVALALIESPYVVIPPAVPAVPMSAPATLPAPGETSSQIAVAAPTVPDPLSPPPLSTQISVRALEARLAADDVRKLAQTGPGLIAASDVPLMVEVALWAGDGPLAASIAALSPNPLDPRLALVIALFDPAKVASAVETRIDAAPSDPAARRLAMRDAMVAWSAGLPVGGGVSFLVQAGLPWGPGSNGGLRAALELASIRGSKGEVALLAALATQGLDPVNVDGETLISAVRALSKVGLNDAARGLARDYILAGYVTLAPSRPAARPRNPTTPAPARAAPAATQRPATPAAQETAPTAPTTQAPKKPNWGTP
jgi:hypothetical protein